MSRVQTLNAKKTLADAQSAMLKSMDHAMSFLADYTMAGVRILKAKAGTSSSSRQYTLKIGLYVDDLEWGPQKVKEARLSQPSLDALIAKLPNLSDETIEKVKTASERSAIEIPEHESELVAKLDDYAMVTTEMPLSQRNKLPWGMETPEAITASVKFNDLLFSKRKAQEQGLAEGGYAVDKNDNLIFTQSKLVKKSEVVGKLAITALTPDAMREELHKKVEVARYVNLADAKVLALAEYNRRLNQVATDVDA